MSPNYPDFVDRGFLIPYRTLALQEIRVLRRSRRQDTRRNRSETRLLPSVRMEEWLLSVDGMAGTYLAGVTEFAYSRSNCTRFAAYACIPQKHSSHSERWPTIDKHATPLRFRT